ncbi:MAG: hypothetical protein WDO14_00325 [Bacteroidota bacterium]
MRVTFTTKDQVDVSAANFETPTASFIYYNEAIKVNSAIFDHTPMQVPHIIRPG